MSMRRLRRRLDDFVHAVAVAAMLFAAGATIAQDDRDPVAAEADLPKPDLRVELDPPRITVGDPVRVRLLLTWPAGAADIDPRFPAWQETWGKTEVLDVGTVARERGTGGQTIFRQDVRITAFETGELKLPILTLAIPIAGRTLDVATPDDLQLIVDSVLAEGEQEPAPRAAAGVRRLPAGAPFWWTLAILGALSIVAALAVARRHPEAFGGLLAAPRLPPYEELQMRLGAIDPAAGSEPAHTAISLALRTYLGRATGLTAVERTTSEIQRALRRGDHELSRGLGRRIVALLHRCDEAKFIARHHVAPAQISERVGEAGAIARTIHTSQQPDEQPADDDQADGTHVSGQEASGQPATKARAGAPDLQPSMEARA